MFTRAYTSLHTRAYTSLLTRAYTSLLTRAYTSLLEGSPCFSTFREYTPYSVAKVITALLLCWNPETWSLPEHLAAATADAIESVLLEFCVDYINYSGIL